MKRPGGEAKLGPPPPERKSSTVNDALSKLPMTIKMQLKKTSKE